MPTRMRVRRGGPSAHGFQRQTGLKVWCSVCLVVCGCTAQSAPESGTKALLSGNHLPVILEASILPSPLVRSQPLSVQIHADDSDRDPLTFRYLWSVNGQVLAGQTGATLPVSTINQGDRVAVEIVPDDGKQPGAAYRTAQATVVNTPPIISGISIRPQSGKPGDKLEALVDAIDPDNDTVEMSFRWWRNKVVILEGDSLILDTTGFSPKDSITVEAIPRDRTAVGTPVKSDPLILRNSPPVIVSTPPDSVGKEEFEYLVRAVDAERDALHYKLETAPPGMTIDGETGRLTWRDAKRVVGTYQVRVVVEDSEGGTAFQEFGLTLVGANQSSVEGA